MPVVTKNGCLPENNCYAVQSEVIQKIRIPLAMQTSVYPSGCRAMDKFPGSTTLICAFAAQNDPEGLDQDLNIEPKRVISNVVQIFLGMQVHGLVAATMDLPPTG